MLWRATVWILTRRISPTSCSPEGRILTALILIVVGAAVLRLVFFTGYHGYDDVYYIQRALELSGGAATPPTTHWAARIGLVGPTALSTALSVSAR